MKRVLIQTLIAGFLLRAGVMSGADTSALALSLQQRIDRGEVVLDILLTNMSTGSVDVVSEGIAPPWSVCAWFRWEVDGKLAEYSENVAFIPEVKESWRVPRGGVILWASIPLRSLKHVVRNEQGQNELRSVIQDANRHVVTIAPTDRWKATRVRPARLEVGQ